MKSNTKRILEAVQYIENNIRNDFTQDNIAQNVYLSKSYLGSIFKALTGRNMMEYVRARKMAHIVHDLSHSSKKVMDIALDYGFSQEQNLIRAFKKSYNITPAKFRNNQTELPIQPKINNEMFVPIHNSILIKPFFKFMPSIKFAGIEYVIGEYENIFYENATVYGNEFFYNQKHRIKGDFVKNIYYAYIRKTIENSNIYMPSVQLIGDAEVPDDMKVHTVPATNYAVFKYAGAHSPNEIGANVLSGIHHYIFDIWMHTTKYTNDYKFHLEKIDQKSCRENYCEMDLYIPVN